MSFTALENASMNLNIGILMVGSLYWDGQQHRQKWRQERLKIDKEYVVRSPIRYGRKSTSRGNTYTMVFSPGCEGGQAKVIACRYPVSSLESLVDEAERLWAAERPANTALSPNERLSANWGCVALLLHPRLLTGPDQKFLRILLDGWAGRVSQEANYNGDEYAAVDGSAIDKNGVLRIGWPDLIDGSGTTPFDLLLATATKPSLDVKTRDYPAATTIAEAWKRDKQGHVCYFWCNRKNGIHTFQDNEISNYLQN